jgi:hypothetical protein
MQGRVGFAALAALITLGAPALAEDRGSMEDQMACTPDVYRLCSRYIPDEDSIVACLQRNVQNLSAGCHKVFTRPSGGGGEDNDN